MPSHSTIRRYTLIIEKISRRQFPSFRELKDFLIDHGFEISTRTLQRDIEQIRFEFGLEIQYERSRNGYYIDEDLSLDIDGFLRFLEIVNTAELLTESLRESRNTLQYISFDATGDLKGIQNLKPLLRAIMEHRKLTFTHENFETGVCKGYVLMPYLLKEYLNRWYLVGRFTGSDRFWTFGIDRIDELEVMDEVFEPEKGLDPTADFRHTIGLTYSVSVKQEIILSFVPLQGKYVKSLPLHWTQKVLIDSETEVRISLNIIPNLEFKQKIMMLGANVRVIEPSWLVEEIKQAYQAALNTYK
jgi:predicted DNA-binding transcriptional regulator YafY